VKKPTRLAVIGAGNIGTLIATGLTRSRLFSPKDVTLTRRKVEALQRFVKRGFAVTGDSRAAARGADVVLLCVEPQQIDPVLREISPGMRSSQILVSVVSDVSIDRLRRGFKKPPRIVRAMPNTAIAIRESMTCIAGEPETAGGEEAIETARAMFSTVGQTLVIDEEQMTAATALGACGVAFFLRAIRSASQGGIEIGFHADQALFIAAQTARGAASLLARKRNHPEFEIDKVTTPRGCTIAGLNRMEHEGFSSAMIRGIVTSAEKAANLYKGK